MKIYDDVDLQKNQLKNVVLENSSEDPANGREGQIVYNSTDKHIKLSTDAGFKKLALEDDVLTAIANADFGKFKIVSQKPSEEEALENIFYLVYNEDTLHYDIYAKIDNQIVWIDDTTIDLKEYAKTAEVDTKLETKVDKEDGKVLSTNDFTTTEKDKLDSIEEGADVNTIENVKVNGVKLTIADEDKSVDIILPVSSEDETRYVFTNNTEDNGIDLKVIKKGVD